MSRVPRKVPEPKYLAPAAKDLLGHEPKVRPGRGAQSKVKRDPPRPARTPEEQEAWRKKKQGEV